MRPSTHFITTIAYIVTTLTTVNCLNKCYFCADTENACKEQKKHTMTCKDGKVDGKDFMDYFIQPNTSGMAAIMEEMAVHIRTDKAHCINLAYSFERREGDQDYDVRLVPQINKKFLLKLCMDGDDCELAENIIRKKHPNVTVPVECFHCNRELCNRVDDFTDDDDHDKNNSTYSTISVKLSLIIISIFFLR